MALKMQATGTSVSFDLSELKANATGLGLDWNLILADIEKYGPAFVATALSIAADISTGNWWKILTDLWALGPTALAAVLAILKDLNVALPATSTQPAQKPKP